MRKGWLFAAVLSGAAGTSSQAADVQIFGINTTSGTWAVYGRISNPNSITAGQLVSGFSSIEIDVFNDQGASAASVLTSVNKLPQGTTPFTDPVFQTAANPTGAVGYGFWLVRSDGTVGPEPVSSGAAATGRTGAFGISGGQYTFGSTTVPYRQLVVPGVGLTSGTVAVDANHTSTTSWSAPVIIASGTYAPGTDPTQGLKMELAPGTFVNLIRDTNPTWTRETAVGTTVIDARNYTLGQSNQGISTVKAGIGDADLDGQVGFSDLVKVAQNYGKTGKTWFDGDFNFDGTVDFADLVTVAQHYGGPAPASSEFSSGFDQQMAAAFASVPEPTTLGFLGLAAAGLAGRRRKNKNA